MVVARRKAGKKAIPGVPKSARPAAIIEDASVRERMLDTAIGLMSAQGYAGTSVLDIVESVGVAPPTLYWYFKSKRGILAAAMQRGAEDWMRRMPQPETLPGATPRERFLSAAKIGGTELRREPQFLRLLIRLSLERAIDDEAVRKTVLDVRRRVRSWLVAVLQNCWPALPLKDATQLASLQMAVGDGWIVAREIEGTGDSPISDLVGSFIADRAENISRMQAPRRRR